MKNLIEELSWRGLVHNIIDGTEEQLLKESTTAYIGFDPTSDSLHIGSLVPIILLVHLKNFGHKPIALVGGATGMIGDPSGKSDERNLLTEEILDKNVAGIKSVLSRFLDFNSTEENAPLLVNNYDWMKDFSFIDFARDVGKRITVNYMMAKDSVKNVLQPTAPECLLQNLPISSSKDTIFTIYIKIITVCCKWEVPTNGEISQQAQNWFVECRKEMRKLLP